MTTTTDNGIFVTEQDIDDWLIRQDKQLEDNDHRSTSSAAQSAEHLQKEVEAAIHNVHLGATRLPPPATTVQTDHT